MTVPLSLNPRIEQGYKQVKDQLGWADFQVRSDTAIRRHQALVNCAFCFCWDAWFADHLQPQEPAAPRPGAGRGERRARTSGGTPGAALAPGHPRRARLAFPWIALQRCWQVWSNTPPPPQLLALINSVGAGRGLQLYLPN
jgi:hypothetical protein